MNEQSKSAELEKTDKAQNKRALPWIEILILLCVCAAALSFLYVVTGRLWFQYDLEWTEGGILLAALRLVDGLPLYTVPSIDYVPFPYPPLYFSMVAFWRITT